MYLITQTQSIKLNKLEVRFKTFSLRLLLWGADSVLSITAVGVIPRPVNVKLPF